MQQHMPIVGFFEWLESKALLSPEALEKIKRQNADRVLGLGLG